jgi:O-6-methylguanine DNA methyltransferase
MLEFDGETLRAVRLPRTIPEDFDAAALRDLTERLAQFPVSLPSVPPFHRRVWDCLRDIPWGVARTYGEVARAVRSPRAVRAVGQACGANPLLLIVPCHRVIAENGLGGFALGTAWKQKLLELEAAVD